MALEPWQLFWAKTDRDGRLEQGPRWTHPLWAHLLDVAHVADALADRLPTRVQDELARGLGLTWCEARPVLALLVGLHDAGKAIPSFQSAHEHSRDALRAAGLALADRYPDAKDRRHHGHASVPILTDWIATLPTPPHGLLTTLAAFVGFHHGRLDPRVNWTEGSALGTQPWRHAQRALVSHVAEAWMRSRGGWPDLSDAPSPDGRLPFPPSALAVAGWTTLADWVGSVAKHMPLDAARHAQRLADYLPESRAAARASIDAAHLDRRPALRAASTVDSLTALFPETFGSGAWPHRLQTITAAVPLPDAPALVLVEAPTGEGKTEAALHLAARLQARRPDGRGLYVALPTQATSNGLFPRVRDFLALAHDPAAGDAGVMLAHGASGLNADLDRLLEPVDDEDAGARAYAARWFLPAKRSLLAPYGVGTVDQALMGAVTSRHFFLRLYGLAGKTVVFDEVHAYDGYTGALLACLLTWLRHLGADVVVLTATLPRATRRALLRAWGAPDVPDPDAYPAVAVAEADRRDSLTAFEGDFETTQTACAHLEFADSSPALVVSRVAEAVTQGATVGVVVNRVDRAQAVFEALGDLDADLHLLHARFPFAERDRRERAALYRFGKAGRRAAQRPAVLVATQVAEQSLDLDVDLMLSDLAPVDLLLQRAGRLHRHPVLHDLRPAGYQEPRLVVLRPPLAAPDALPDVSAVGGQFRPDRPEGIYLDLPLFRTDLELRTRVGTSPGWSLPNDYRPLVEAVYCDASDRAPDGLSPDDAERWAAAVRAKADLTKTFAATAERASIGAPARLGDLAKSGLYAKRTAYDEGDDAPARDLKPQTRLGGPSVQAVCLHRRDGRLFLDPDGTTPLPPGPRLDPDETRDVLRCAVRLSRKSVVHAIDAVTEPEWDAIAAETPALAYHHPLVFENGRCVVGRTVVELHPDLGIRYDPDPA